MAVEEALDGQSLRRVFAAASDHLRACAKAVDAINVYPVPDGDTGSNMSATLREAVERALVIEGEPSVSEVLTAIAKGALYGARGNSGVILSQALRGFAIGVGERDRLDGGSLAEGLQQAAEQAYRAVSKPQEGTMLTVLRLAGAAAREEAGRIPSDARDSGCARVLGAALSEATRAEAATMEQLPALREAGVPDAGGEGICVILAGLLSAITGRAFESPARAAERPLILGAVHGEDPYGFCTEFLIEADHTPLDPPSIRALVESLGNRSILAVGDSELVRVHAHSLDPEGLLRAAERFGTLARVKFEDMSAQNVRFRESGSGAPLALGVLAMSRGAGFDAVFTGLGATVSDLGVVQKPPAGQIAHGADGLGATEVIVLANHKNVLLAAEQAKELARSKIHVVPTTSLPQGIAAMMAYDPREGAAGNLERMAEGARAVRTIEVTIAGASRTSDGVAVRKGDAIVLVDGTLVAAATIEEDALIAGLERVGASSGELITVYAGEEVSEGRLRALVGTLREKFPDVDVEGLSGRQPLYPFIASVE